MTGRFNGGTQRREHPTASYPHIRAAIKLWQVTLILTTYGWRKRRTVVCMYGVRTTYLVLENEAMLQESPDFQAVRGSKQEIGGWQGLARVGCFTRARSTSNCNYG